MVMNALSGGAGLMSEKDRQDFAERVCADGEQIEAAFNTKRDSYVFTDRRLVLEEVQGMTGTKRKLVSIPYSKISAFSVETAGHFEPDGELKIWISGAQLVVEREFRRSVDVYLLQALLASKTR